MGDLVSTPVGCQLSFFPHIRNQLTIPGYFCNEDNQLGKAQDKDTPSDLAGEPSFLLRA